MQSHAGHGGSVMAFWKGAGRNLEYQAMSALGQKQTCAMQTAMSALTPKADIAGKFATLGSGYLNARRNATAAKLMTSTVRSITSIEPSPLSGEKPTCRSIKSMGAALLRSTQSSNVPQTAIIEPKAISPPRAGSI
jgi:hypothetical protein